MDTGEAPEVRDILGSEAGDTGANGGAPPQLPQTLSPGGMNAPQAGKLVFGKFKDMQAAEKAYKGLESQFTKEGQSHRKQALEAILQREDLKKLVSSDPQLREAMTKAGYSLAEIQEEEQERQAQATGDVWNGDENDPRYQVKLIREELRLRDQRSELETELGRRLKEEEIAQIKEVMRTVSPTMHVKQAWRITPSFELEIKAKQDKELAKLRGANGAAAGPRLPVNLLPQGQKGDANKARRAMSPAEKREALMDTVRKNM